VNGPATYRARSRLDGRTLLTPISRSHYMTYNRSHVDLRHSRDTQCTAVRQHIVPASYNRPIVQQAIDWLNRYNVINQLNLFNDRLEAHEDIYLKVTK